MFETIVIQGGGSDSKNAVSINTRIESSKIPLMFGGNIGRVLGSGTYGTVFSLEMPKAVKVMRPLEHTDENDVKEELEYFLKRATREVEILTRLRGSPGIIDLYQSVLEKTDDGKGLNVAYLLLPSYEGSLSQLIKQDHIISLSRNNRYNIINQINCGLLSCHKIGVAHRDIKSCNFLYRFDGLRRVNGVTTADTIHIVLTDFGLSKFIDTCDDGRKRQKLNQKPTSCEVYTLWYRPPEYTLVGMDEIHFLNTTLSGDVWSLACVWAEVLLKKRIFSTVQASNEYEHAMGVQIFIELAHHGGNCMGKVKVRFQKMLEELLAKHSRVKLEESNLSLKRRAFEKSLSSIMDLDLELEMGESIKMVDVHLKDVKDILQDTRELKNEVITSIDDCKRAIGGFEQKVKVIQDCVNRMSSEYPSLNEIWLKMLHPVPEERYRMSQVVRDFEAGL